MDMSTLDKIAGKSVDRSNANALIVGFNQFPAGIALPHRTVHFLAQVLHESACLTFDHEIWGPTEAQVRYEGRTDLGNVNKGDGFLFRGRGPIQCTGRVNYRLFYGWCLKEGFDAPDFEASPDMLLSDPWEGLSAVWFWDTRSLNRYADDNDIETITRRINGGLNGYDDRLNWYTRSGLVFLDFGPAEVRAYQQSRNLKADNIPGKNTRASIHNDLKKIEVVGPSVEERIKDLERRIIVLENS